jgi:hypothetical protein
MIKPLIASGVENTKQHGPSMVGVGCCWFLRLTQPCTQRQHMFSGCMQVMSDADDDVRENDGDPDDDAL